MFDISRASFTQTPPPYLVPSYLSIHGKMFYDFKDVKIVDRYSQLEKERHDTICVRLQEVQLLVSRLNIAIPHDRYKRIDLWFRRN